MNHACIVVVGCLHLLACRGYGTRLVPVIQQILHAILWLTSVNPFHKHLYLASAGIALMSQVNKSPIALVQTAAIEAPKKHEHKIMGSLYTSLSDVTKLSSQTQLTMVVAVSQSASQPLSSLSPSS